MKRGFVFPGVHGEPITPKPGIWPDVPFDQYLSWNAISNSSMAAAVRDLNPLTLSMGHYRDQVRPEETPALRFGKYCHAGRFEFLTALKEYVVLPDLIKFDLDKEGNVFESQCRTDDGKPTESKNAKQYKDRLSRFTQRHIGKQFVTHDELERQEHLLYALDCDEKASEYFHNNGPTTEYEVAIVWKDPITGLMCKGRLDCVQHDARLVIDLKTTPNVCRFPNSIATYGYHRQGAFYGDGLQVLTGNQYRAANVAVEGERPFPVHAAPLSFATQTAGRVQYRSILNQIARCVETDDWPTAKRPTEWQIPAYALPDTAVA